MRINSRSKGMRGEREVGDLLQQVADQVGREMDLKFVPEVKRNLVQSREGGCDLVGIPGLAVEVKYQECDWKRQWWEQCVEQAARRKAIPILIWRRNHQAWQVQMIAHLPCGHTSLPARVTLGVDPFLDWLYQYLINYHTGITKTDENNSESC
jgi:hypothetical protein